MFTTDVLGWNFRDKYPDFPRSFDGNCTFADSYDAIKEATDSVDVVELAKAHFNEFVTPQAIPLFTLDHESFFNLFKGVAELARQHPTD